MRTNAQSNVWMNLHFKQSMCVISIFDGFLCVWVSAGSKSSSSLLLSTAENSIINSQIIIIAAKQIIQFNSIYWRRLKVNRTTMYYDIPTRLLRKYRVHNVLNTRNTKIIDTYTPQQIAIMTAREWWLAHERDREQQNNTARPREFWRREESSSIRSISSIKPNKNKTKIMLDYVITAATAAIYYLLLLPAVRFFPLSLSSSS